ncbi:SDR family NAD(P)-dependent oxidoreductase [Microbacterium sp. Marseille-Q6648]|uniref:SDR family NAD(P)-dependent oxidoreductase n=1 Tax=Microbacterium sp. Marseille-Q6648 TaxID=2937991 RepID=UPI003336293F
MLLAGATSAVGLATARALARADARVVAVGRDRGKLDVLAEAVPDIVTVACDLTDEADVDRLATRVHEGQDTVDGLVHLVGGWRGGGARGPDGSGLPVPREVADRPPACLPRLRRRPAPVGCGAIGDRLVAGGVASPRGRRQLRGGQGRERGLGPGRGAGVREGCARSRCDAERGVRHLPCELPRPARGGTRRCGRRALEHRRRRAQRHRDRADLTRVRHAR